MHIFHKSFILIRYLIKGFGHVFCRYRNFSQSCASIKLMKIHILLYLLRVQYNVKFLTQNLLKISLVNLE